LPEERGVLRGVDQLGELGVKARLELVQRQWQERPRIHDRRRVLEVGTVRR